MARTAGSQAAPLIRATESGAATTTIRPTTGAAATAASVQASSGRPATSARTLSTPAIRLEAPAATTMASALPAGGGSSARLTSGSSIEPRLGEDHPPGDRLQDPGDGDIDVLVEVPRPPSTTTIVPSSRKPTPWPASLPSWMTRTRISSPGRTTGFTALASG